MSTLEDKIVSRGINSLLSSWDYQKYLKDWIAENKDFLEENLANLNPDNFNKVFCSFVKKAPERMSKPIWQNKIRQVVKNPSYKELYNFANPSNGFHSFKRDLASLYFSLVKIRIEAGELNTTWKDLFDDISPQILNNYTSQTTIEAVIPDLTTEYFKECPEEAKSMMHNIDFKARSINLRRTLYFSYIRAGLLDKKVARRIRSETSENISEAAIKDLLNNLSLYENPKALLTQFTDTRHYQVQDMMAGKAPNYMLPFMMGFDSPYAKSILESRIANVAKAKE